MGKRGNSQNGWPVFDDTSCFVRTFVAGVGFWSANADVAVVLDDYTRWFNDHIERLDLPADGVVGKLDDWSYAFRPIRGQTLGYSNHASATARDLNATRHPRGKHGTFTTAQRRAMRARMDNYLDPVTHTSVIRLGEFYTESVIDGMHVEIDAPKVSVKRVADILRSKNQPMKEAQMELTDHVKLTPAAATAMNSLAGTPRKAGDELTVSFLLQWGGPRLYQVLADTRALKAQNAAILAQLKTLTSAVNGIVAGSPAAIQAAFADGVAELKDEITRLEIRVVSDEPAD